MIVYKTWEKTKSIGSYNRKYYRYRGWFLFGVLPLYIERIDLS